MLVKVEELKEVNSYISQFGLNIIDGVVYGDVYEDILYPKTMPAPLPATELQEMALGIVKAKHHTNFKNIVVGLYIGNLPKVVKEELLDNGFIVNDNDVLIIRDTVYEVYDHLVYLTHNMHASKGSIDCIHRIIDGWPSSFILEVATSAGILKIANSDKGISLESTRVPTFDYHYNARVFQTVLPVPLDNINKTNITSIVQVNVTENEDESCYKYTVSVADYPSFQTDTLPTPDNIQGLITIDMSWIHKIKRMVKEIFC